MTKILIADDHPLTLLGTKSFVETLGYTSLETHSNGLAAFTAIQNRAPHLAILDINMPGMTGLEILEKIFLNKLPTKVILLTMHKEYSIFKKAEEFHVAGYLTKEKAFDELKTCIETVLGGNTFVSEDLKNVLFADSNLISEDQIAGLSLAETRILQLIHQEKTSKQIAELFFVSEKMIEKQRSQIIEKLGLPKAKNALLKWVLRNFKQ